MSATYLQTQKTASHDKENALGVSDNDVWRARAHLALAVN